MNDITRFVCTGFVSRDMLLPDAALIHGRALVCAWETGLQDVQDNVVKVIIHALEVCYSNDDDDDSDDKGRCALVFTWETGL